MKATKQIKNKIRELCPELMELSFGCEVKDTHNQLEYVVCNKSVNDDLYVSCGTLESTQYRVPRERVVIIGHPIQLSHLLRAIGDRTQHFEYVTWEETHISFVLKKTGKLLQFDLTKSVHQNLEENEELREFIYNLLVKE